MPLSVQAILNASDSSGTCVPSDTSDTFSTPERLAEMETMLMNWCNDNEVIVLAAKLDPVYSKVSALLMQKNDTVSRAFFFFSIFISLVARNRSECSTSRSRPCMSWPQGT